VECRPNSNASNVVKSRSLQGEITYKRRRVKEGNKKVDMVDILPI
jgi:hypothetical protein